MNINGNTVVLNGVCIAEINFQLTEQIATHTYYTVGVHVSGDTTDLEYEKIIQQKIEEIKGQYGSNIVQMKVNRYWG